MAKAHCPRCAGYEDKVMRRAPDEELAPDVRPCQAFEMSDRFREWAVAQMRREMAAEVGAAGLDRMAIHKAAGAKERTLPPAGNGQADGAAPLPAAAHGAAPSVETPPQMPAETPPG